MVLRNMKVPLPLPSRLPKNKKRLPALIRDAAPFSPDKSIWAGTTPQGREIIRKTLWRNERLISDMFFEQRIAVVKKIIGPLPKGPLSKQAQSDFRDQILAACSTTELQSEYSKYALALPPESGIYQSYDFIDVIETIEATAKEISARLPPETTNLRIENAAESGSKTNFAD